MADVISLSELEKKIDSALADDDINTTVELENLPENQYRELARELGDKYEINGIVRVLGRNKKNYTLHIRRSENA